MEKAIVSLQSKLGEIEDFRKQKGMQYRLVDLLFSSFVALLCGADDFEAMALFCERKKSVLNQFCSFNQTPSHDTFRRLFGHLDSRQFLKAVLEWLGAEDSLGDKVLVNIDGKAIRATRTREHVKSALQVVSAWVGEAGMLVGQEQVDSKSNEKAAIPLLLDALELRGSIVSIDAMGSHVTIAQKVIERGGDYLLALKKNNKCFFVEIENYFDQLQDMPLIDVTPLQQEINGGRQEQRQAWVSHQTAFFAELADAWPNLNSIIQVTSWRTKNEKTSIEKRFYLSSATLSAEQALHYVRRHWSIENELHWYLDVVFKEDAHRIRYKNTAQNLSLFRKLALKALKDYDLSKHSVAHKRLQLAWDDQYLLDLLRKFSCV